ncbi:MAG: ABC transporter ATP-binding protein [Oscillospiraceae bacterium]
MLRLFKNFTKREWGMIAISVAFILGQVWLDLRLPDYMSDITLLVQTPGSAMADILAAGGKMLLCALGSLASALVVGFFAARVAARLSRRLRERVYDRVQSFSMEELSGFSTASLITRSTNDITQIEMIVAMGLQVMVKAPIMAVMAVAKIQAKGCWQWSTLTGCAVVLLITTIVCIMLYAVPRFKKIQVLTDNLNRVTRENLTGLRVVRAYNAEDYQERKFEKSNNELTDNNLQANRAMQVMNPVMTIIMNGMTLGIYWLGAYIINASAMADKLTVFSNMVVFSSYSMQVIMAFMMLTMIFIMLPRAQVSAKRINEVLETVPTITDGDVTETPSDLRGEVEFRNVSFHYPDAEDDVLHDISFTAKRGETVAFIGSTGSGKSTIVSLATRLYDASEGEVLIDGVNVKSYTQEALHNKLGYVPQKAVLFAGTVASNVAYGDNGRPAASLGDITGAVAVAQSADFVASLEGGFEGAVAQGGSNFSGGQKQRLAIARAVCRRPEIYIFDDSFSALDYKTDRALRAALKRETGEVTSLIVAQRIGTIRDADRIVVIDDGAVAGIGTHDELMKTCEVYREIAYSQLSKEELE